MKLPRSGRKPPSLIAAAITGLVLMGCASPGPAPDPRPNILLVLTDDQGYGDIGFNGNPVVQTPRLDTFSTKAIIFDQFYTQPVCSPTRAALLTGKHPVRSGVVDTEAGAALLPAEMTTLAEALQANGYATGLFGKWHLGDNAPMRPQDQGFEQVLSHDGGMIGTWYSPPGGASYFDPILWENGEQRKFDGYAPDIFTDAAIDFIREAEGQPFFAFLSFNTPHHPLTVSDMFAETYREAGLSEETARYYGMIENIDFNFGRVVDALDASGQLDSTIIVFLSDNGTSSLHRQDDLWETGLRGRKTYVYENGIRVPMFIRVPGQALISLRTAEPATVEDVMPTLLEAAGINFEFEFDGVSLLPLLQGEVDALPERNLFFQFHRGTLPEPFRNIAVRSGAYKLVQPVGRGTEPFSLDTARFELYDLEADPFERNDISAQYPERVNQLISVYRDWVEEDWPETFEPRPIWIGSSLQNPVILTRQDWWGGPLRDGVTAPYHLDVRTPGNYRLTFRWNELLSETRMVTIKLGDRIWDKQILQSELEARIESVALQAGSIALEAWTDIDGVKSGFRFIEIEKLPEGDAE